MKRVTLPEGDSVQFTQALRLTYRVTYHGLARLLRQWIRVEVDVEYEGLEQK